METAEFGMRVFGVQNIGIGNISQALSDEFYFGFVVI
jgi:hypothetical protein